MLYSFDIHLQEEDYLKFNLFHNLVSPYGKPTIFLVRLLYSILLFLFVFISCSSDGLSTRFFSKVLFSLLLFAVLQLLVKPMLRHLTKKQLNQLKKANKLKYSPDSRLEFYEDIYKSFEPNEKSERTYATIERVAVAEGEAIYLYLNAFSAIIIPLDAFPTSKEKQEFIAFLKERCQTLETYPQTHA